MANTPFNPTPPSFSGPVVPEFTIGRGDDPEPECTSGFNWRAAARDLKTNVVIFAIVGAVVALLSGAVYFLFQSPYLGAGVIAAVWILSSAVHAGRGGSKAVRRGGINTK